MEGYRSRSASGQIMTDLYPVLRIRDVYPGSWFLAVPDPGSKNSNERTGVKKNLLSYLFFGAINFPKLNYFIFEMLKKKIWANFQRITELFIQKLSLSSQKYGFGIRDPRSGKNLFRIPDPGVKKAPDPGSGSATLSVSRSTLTLSTTQDKQIQISQHILKLKHTVGYQYQIFRYYFFEQIFEKTLPNSS